MRDHPTSIGLPRRTPPRILFHPRSPAIAAVVLAIGAAAFAWAPSAQADESGAAAPGEAVFSAHIVSIDGEDFFIDLTSNNGVHPGDIVELWRPLRITHPVTRRTLEDRFRIGSVRLGQVGQVVSLARPEGELARPPKLGDIVLVRRAASVVPAVPGAQLPPAPNLPVPPGQPASTTVPEDPEAAELTRIFDALRGSDPVARIRAYEDYVRRRPDAKYAAVLYEEAQALRRLIAAERAGSQAPTDASQPADVPRIVQFDQPFSVIAEAPLSLGVELAGPVQGAILHVRNGGEVAYTTEPMKLAGSGYYTAVVPASRMRAGSLEYFLEATGPAGLALPLRGQAEQPLRIVVAAVPKPLPPERLDATFTLLTDLASYNGLKSNDYAWQTEGVFGLRYGDVGVRAFRSGFGVYRGAGGTIEDLDVLGRQPRAIGLTYGYLELEFGASEFVSFLGRTVVGLRDDGLSGGAQGAMRLGNDRKTNLLLGGEFLGGVGMRGFTQLELNTFPRVPIVIRSEVTNQPAGVSDPTPRAQDTSSTTPVSSAPTEVGARGIVQVGYRFLPPLVVALRASYQGRTINHAGPGLGAAVTYSW